MIYIRKIYNQDIDANHQMQVVKEPAYTFFGFPYNPTEKNLDDKAFTLHFENFFDENGVQPIISPPIQSRIYQSSATKKGKTTCEARLGSDLRNYLKANLQFEVGDIIVFRNKKGKTDIDYSNIYVDYISKESILYQAYLAFLQNENHCVALASEDLDESTAKEEVKHLQVIYYGAPGTGKSHTIQEQTEGESVIRTTFHPDSDYSTFVGAYKPTTKEVELRDVSGHKIIEAGKVVTEDRIVYEFVDQAFLQAYVNAWTFFANNEGNPKKQFLIIEEINRGNCAQIFGDLFQLLDRNDMGFSDYPINADKDIKKHLKKAFDGLSISTPSGINNLYKGRDVVNEVFNGDILLLPNNLYIWATMNTSDQSLFPIDSAFKRRWDWQYMPIAQGRDDAGNELKWTINVNDKKFIWWSFIEKINAQIGEATQSEDKKLGFFFCKANHGVISPETFVGKVLFYLWNDVFKDYGFEGSIFKDADNSELSFNKFYKADFKGNAVVQQDKVELFLNNLGVEFIENTQEGTPSESTEEESEEDGSRNRFRLNGGSPESLKDIANHVVRNYAISNPSMNAQQIRDTLVNAYSGCGVSHIVETDDEYNLRANQTSWERSASTVTLRNGENLHVCTQFRAKNEGDNFFKFIKITKENGWGEITIA